MCLLLLVEECLDFFVDGFDGWSSEGGVDTVVWEPFVLDGVVLIDEETRAEGSADEFEDSVSDVEGVGDVEVRVGEQG